MNTSPIDSYDGAEAYYTFGPDSVGMWIFLVLAFAVFIYVGVRAMQLERHGFAEVTTDPEA
jgi:hypothetical protein